MSESTTALPSLDDRVRRLDAGSTVVGVHFLGDTPVFVLGDEALLFAGEDGERRVAVHKGAILASATDGARIVTGGDDGTVVSTGANGEHAAIATDDKKRWIDQLPRRPGGAGCWSARRTRRRATQKR